MKWLAILASAASLLNLAMWAASGNTVALVAMITNAAVALTAAYVSRLA